MFLLRFCFGRLKTILYTQQLTCRYFRTKAYFEVDIDIGSSMVAYNTVSLAIGYAKSLVADIGFCIQVRLGPARGGRRTHTLHVVEVRPLITRLREEATGLCSCVSDGRSLFPTWPSVAQ